mgnify:CR=1 FL=1
MNTEYKAIVEVPKHIAIVNNLASLVFAAIKPQIKAYIQEQVAELKDELSKDFDDLEERIERELDERIHDAFDSDDLLDSHEFSNAVEEIFRNMDIEVHIR